MGNRLQLVCSMFTASWSCSFLIAPWYPFCNSYSSYTSLCLDLGSLEAPWQLHGTSMIAPWQLHGTFMAAPLQLLCIRHFLHTLSTLFPFSSSLLLSFLPNDMPLTWFPSHGESFACCGQRSNTNN